MGFASREEITALFEEIETVLARTGPAKEQLIHRTEAMLPKVRDDGLHRRLSSLLQTLKAAG